jgi:hypothetical protein
VKNNIGYSTFISLAELKPTSPIGSYDKAGIALATAKLEQ